MWQFSEIRRSQLAREMRKARPEYRGDLSRSLNKLAEAHVNFVIGRKTHRIGVIAKKSTDVGPEPHTLTNHLEDVDGEEEHQRDSHAQEAISRALAFEFGNEQLYALDYAHHQHFLPN